MSESTDLAAALPTDTGTFSAGSMLPVGKLDTHHLLLLADDVTADEVEALALSQDIQAGWVGVSSLQLFPGAYLQGPWDVDAQMRSLLGAPEWTSQLMVLDCPRVRAGALPPALAGKDPLADAFPLAQPTGAELVALTRMRAIARRLAGALRLIPGAPDGADPVLIEPSPEVSASLTVYGPVWIGPEDLAALLGQRAPGMRPALHAVEPPKAIGLDAVDPDKLERLVETIGAEVFEKAWHASKEVRSRTEWEEARAAASGGVIEDELDGYAVIAPVDGEREGWGSIEVQVGATDGLPLAVRGESWARGAVLSYDLRWKPLDQADAYEEVVSRSRRRERQTARDLIEELATILVGAVTGVAVDDDGFLVSLDPGQ
ncbi:hypothetical protein ACSL103130_09785 [Actinomyces slackii]|uniref:Uncharacterized protein n=1 Tax=Actinomyces slackii TaxID=52774 RepID=A0A3S4TBP7_9ACTO|nr:hypothetical protein [Actinomyces slackii]VEG74221.1 Uncharacterised protein [Actinomyces slackii]